MAKLDKTQELLKLIKNSDVPDSDFDPQQLKKGTKVEMEHTSSKEIAKAIAKTHLLESPDYYKLLSDMEKKLEK